MEQELLQQIILELKELKNGQLVTNSRLEGIDTRLDGIDTRLDGIDTRLDGIDTRLDGIDNRLDGIDTRLDGMDTRLDGIDTRLGIVESDLSELKEHAEVTRTATNSLVEWAETVGVITQVNFPIKKISSQ